MQKTKFTVYLSEPVAASVETLMAAEDRTFSNVVERVLKAALAEPGDSVGVAQWKERSPGNGQPERKDGSSSLPSGSSGSASVARKEPRTETCVHKVHPIRRCEVCDA